MKYNVLDYGAKPSEKELQTAGIQKAVDECFTHGGGTVVVPKGVYLTGDIRLRSNVTLYLESGAHLLGSQNPLDYFNHRSDKIEPLRPEQITEAPYVHLSTIKGETKYEENKTEYRFKRIPASRWNNGLIRAIDATNVSIIGEEGSIIDGNNCFDEIGEELFRGPHAMTFFNCKNIVLKGYTVQNSANWAHNMLYTDNITMDGVTVLAGHDGFDAAVCNNITITNCTFHTGDDSIAGFGNENVYVADCEINSACSAFRFGGTNVTIERCHMYAPCKYSFRGPMSMEEKRACAPSPRGCGRNNMLSAFTYYADYSLPIKVKPGNIIMRDCKIDNADRLLHYNYSGNETWQKNRPLADITFDNIVATDVKMPLHAYGSPAEPIELTIKNSKIVFTEEARGSEFIQAGYFSKINLYDLKTNINGETIVKTWSEGEINVKNVEHEAKNISVMSENAFECRPI